MSEVLKIINFNLLDVQMCIELQHVNKILPLMELERLPVSPPYIVGLMNLAGSSVAIIDLALLLGMKRSNKYSLTTPIILISQGDVMVGLIVDNIVGLFDTTYAKIQKQVYDAEASLPYLGAININNSLSLLIDTQKLLVLCFPTKELESKLTKEMYQYE